MRVIEDQCPFSDVAMAKGKRKTGKKTRPHNTYHSDERDSGIQLIYLLSVFFP